MCNAPLGILKETAIIGLKTKRTFVPTTVQENMMYFIGRKITRKHCSIVTVLAEVLDMLFIDGS